MDERHIEFGIREALGLPDGEILDYATARLIEAAKQLGRILEETSLADLYAACYDAAAEPIRAVPRRVRPKRKPPPPVGRSQSWIRVVQRTVKASGRLHPKTDTTSPNCIKLHERPRMGRGRSLWERSGRHDCCNQRRRADPSGAAERGAEGCGVPGNLPRLFVSAS